MLIAETDTWESGARRARCSRRWANSGGWNHRIVNVLDALPKKLQAQARELLTKIPYAEAEQQKRQFQAWATKKGAATAARRLDEDWERLVKF